MWDPAQYGRYAGERGRPFHDLLARVDAAAPAYVVDLGCGAGELTHLLAARWPTAAVEGVDSSPQMIEAARPAAKVRFTLGEASQWRPGQPVDVLLSSATLQWVDGHEQLLLDLVGCLAPHGWVAVQVPGNFAAPSHVLLREVARRWLPDLPIRVDPVLGPVGYAELLLSAGCRVQAWETTYVHVLSGPDPVLEWVKGTALPPVLAALGPERHDAFLAEYGAALRCAYPAGPYGTFFPFRRVFAVGQAC